MAISKGLMIHQKKTYTNIWISAEKLITYNKEQVHGI
jgi:hypothetical protein